jgi:hypothetical protein
MSDILKLILENIATQYIISFGGLGLVLFLALNSLHKNFRLSEREWGLATLGVGAVGGVLLQAGGLVALPGNGTVGYALAAFVGAASASAAAGFSAIDLRATISKPKV